MDQLPRLGKRELVCLLLFTCTYVVSVWRSFLFLWVLGMGFIILFWHSLSLPYNYFSLPVHSGPLKRIDCLKQICLAHLLLLNVFTALKGTHLYILLRDTVNLYKVYKGIPLA